MTGPVLKNFRIWDVGLKANKAALRALAECAGESTIAAATPRLVLRGHAWESQETRRGKEAKYALSRR